MSNTSTLVKPGHYTAKILNYGIGETKKNDPQVMIKFGFQDKDGAERTMTWYGQLGEKSLRHTLKALIVCGLSKDLPELADGPNGGALNIDQEVEITISNEDYKGKMIAKVQWVNPLGGGTEFKSKMTRQDAKSKLANLNIKGDLMALREEMGVQSPVKGKTPPTQQTTPGDFGHDDEFPLDY